MTEHVLEGAASADHLSFYGLVYWLDECDKLLERADYALLAKKVSSEDQAIADRKPELLEAQARLRRTMGANLDQPSLTRRERPLAEEFLDQQLSKLEGSGNDPRASRAVERLKSMQAALQKSKVAFDSKLVRDIEAEMKRVSIEWKEVAPIYEKWEAGKHKFKSNDELQALRRRYNECEKSMKTAPDRLRAALCAKRDPNERPPEEEKPLPAGWAAVASRPAPTARPVPKQPPRLAAKTSRWDNSSMTIAQRLQAQAAAEVREEACAEEAHEEKPIPRPTAKAPPPHQLAAMVQEDEDQSEEDDDEETIALQQHIQMPPPPPVPILAKQPPPLSPVHQPTGQEEQVADVDAVAPVRQAPSSKKKSKVGKKKGGTKVGVNEDDSFVAPEPKAPRGPPRSAAWVAQAEEAIAGSVLHELLRPTSWSLLEEGRAAERLTGICERLPWTSPLGLKLPLEWKEFAGLELDGGPERKGRRGTPEWVQRIEKNFSSLLAHYLTITFFVVLLHALSHFGLLIWIAGAQAVLCLVPPEVVRTRGSTCVVALQVFHLLLWLLFIRYLWLMHFFMKVFTVMLISLHAYVVVPIDA